MADKEPAYLADYVTVNQRVALFHAVKERGHAIRTRCVYDDGKTIRFVACAHYDPTIACRLAEDPQLRGCCLNADGTGWAEEVRGAGYVNKTSALENCETSAVGRALAQAGIAVEKSIASREEVEQAQAERERQEREEVPEVLVQAKAEAKLANKEADDAERRRAEEAGETEVLGLEGGRDLLLSLDKVVDRDRMRLAATHVRGSDIGDLTSDPMAAESLGRLTLEQVYRLRAWADKKATEAKA